MTNVQKGGWYRRRADGDLTPIYLLLIRIEVRKRGEESGPDYDVCVFQTYDTNGERIDLGIGDFEYYRREVQDELELVDPPW